jgi:uroporphyrinogen-III synthase
VSFVTAYRRVPPDPDAFERALLQQATRQPGRHLWFFSSSEAIDQLAALAPAATWGAARALATHPRIAERARRAGFGAVSECRPMLAAVVACIQSMAS